MENNWSIAETKQLFNLVFAAYNEGRGLSHAFQKMAHTSGKSVNSIRNYYYSQLKLFEMMPSFAKELGINTVGVRRDTFKTFSNQEINQLIETVLLRKAKGQSVRAVISELSGGDKKLGLRLQNKYRSMIFSHRDRVGKIIDNLKSRNVVYFDPYTKKIVTGRPDDDNVSKLADYISKLDSEQMVDVVKKLLAGKN